MHSYPYCSLTFWVPRVGLDDAADLKLGTIKAFWLAPRSVMISPEFVRILFERSQAGLKGYITSRSGRTPKMDLHEPL